MRLTQTSFVSKFACTGASCEDTCCKGWGMQVDKGRLALYKEKAPELLEAVGSGEAEHVMKRDPETDYCVKFSEGLCGIHRDYGTDFLGDACHFYPRVTRQMGPEKAVMTATMSCPEIARLILFGDEPFAPVDTTIDRVPEAIVDYLFEGITAEKMAAANGHFIRMAEDATTPPERSMMRIITVSRSLSSIEPEQWAEAAEFFLRTADMRLLPAQPHEADLYRLLHALGSLVGAAKSSSRPRLMDTIATMEKALNATLDWKNLQIVNNAQDLSASVRLVERWKQGAEQAMAPYLRRWLQAQMSLACFPFAGFGDTLTDQAYIIGVRFATVRLALMAHVAEDGTPPGKETVVRVIQSISRFLDHLMDPAFSLAIYKDAGWMQESRMRGMLEG